MKSPHAFQVTWQVICLFGLCLLNSTLSLGFPSVSSPSPKNLHYESQDLPLGWSCEVKKYNGESFTISQNTYSSDAMFWVDWGDGSAPEAHRGSGSTVHTYQDSGLFPVGMYICLDQARSLNFRQKRIIWLDLSNLDQLLFLRADRQGHTTTIASGVGRKMRELILPTNRNNHPLNNIRADYNETSNLLDIRGFPPLLLTP